MKKSKHLIFLILCHISLIVIGQNTIHRNNYFTLENSYNYLFLDNLEEASVIVEGNNVVWDLSGAIETTQLDTTFAKQSATTIFYNEYPNSNFCLFEPRPISYLEQDMDLYSYYLSSSSSVELIGLKTFYNSGLDFYKFTDLDKQFQFPFSLNDSFQDSYTGSYFIDDGTDWHTIEGIRQVTADGFGTLVLPNITYENCLRIKSIQDGTDTCATQGVANYTIITYTWFQLSRNGPILHINTNFTPVEAKYYYENPLIGIGQLNQNTSFKLFPNPVTDILHIDYNSTSDIESIQVYDVMGKLVLDTVGDINQLDVSKIQSGVLFVKVATEKGVMSKKVVKP